MAAIRLRVAGHDVVVAERMGEMRGKLATYQRDGYTFDIGPSLVTMPRVFDDVFHLAGTSLDAELSMQRLSPQFRYFWQNHSAVTFYDSPIDTADALEAMSPGTGDEYLQFLDHARRIWEVSERTFFAGPMSGTWSLMRRMCSPRDLAAIDARRTLAKAARKHFTDPRMHQWLGRYATYSGSSPFATPATLSCIPALEADEGAWYPAGGLGALREAIIRVAERVGVRMMTNTEVTQVLLHKRRVVGVRLASGDELAAQVVVANVDAEHLYRDLVPNDKQLKRVARAGRSTSGVVVLVGARGKSEHLAHHNVWFSRDYVSEFAAMERGELPKDPTIYACVSSVTDASQAPNGCENWFLLVNAPAGADVDTNTYGPWLVDRLAKIGVDLRERAEFIETIGPRDMEARYRSPGGAIYGTSSNGMRAAFRRPSNIGAARGLYLVGGSSHPGGGLPMVTMSARIVADLVR